MERVATLLGLAIIFLIVAVLAYVFGAKGVAGLSMDIAKILIAVFVVLFVISFVFGAVLNA
jgi:uncharacterized membrane protein YtjA (UPF0391 family)